MRRPRILDRTTALNTRVLRPLCQWLWLLRPTGSIHHPHRLWHLITHRHLMRICSRRRRCMGRLVYHPRLLRQATGIHLRHTGHPWDTTTIAITSTTGLLCRRHHHNRPSPPVSRNQGRRRQDKRLRPYRCRRHRPICTILCRMHTWLLRHLRRYRLPTHMLRAQHLALPPQGVPPLWHNTCTLPLLLLELQAWTRPLGVAPALRRLLSTLNIRNIRNTLNSHCRPLLLLLEPTPRPKPMPTPDTRRTTLACTLRRPHLERITTRHRRRCRDTRHTMGIRLLMHPIRISISTSTSTSMRPCHRTPARQVSRQWACRTILRTGICRPHPLRLTLLLLLRR
jgi:hypothetical protein